MVSVGQKLWRVERGRRATSGYEVTVDKVGRKYFTLEGHRRERYHVDTLRLDTQFSTWVECWVSRRAYEDSEALYKAWTDFKDKIRNTNGVPDGIDLQSIQIAMGALGFYREGTA